MVRGAILGMRTATARQGGIQVPTLNCWQACQRNQGIAMIKLTLTLSLSYKQLRSILMLLMLLFS